MRQLRIYQSQVLAGMLTEYDHHHYEFVYEPSYMQSGFRGISPTMPVSEQPYESSFLFPVFANMLPEGANRSTVCRMKHIDEQDEMGLLMAFAGKDFIGDIHVERV